MCSDTIRRSGRRDPESEWDRLPDTEGSRKKPIVATARFDDGPGFLGVIRSPRACLPCEAESFEELLIRLAACIEQNRDWLIREGYDAAGPRSVVFNDLLPASSDASGQSLTIEGSIRDGRYCAEFGFDGHPFHAEADSFAGLVEQIVSALAQATLRPRPRIRLCVQAALNGKAAGS